jgi:hypothetical protein
MQRRHSPQFFLVSKKGPFFLPKIESKEPETRGIPLF